MNLTNAPGPYRAHWVDPTYLSVSTFHDGLVAAAADGDLLLKLTGGGLTSPRVLTVQAPGWQLAPTYTESVHADVARAQAVDAERILWKRWVPAALVILAIALAMGAYRHRPPRDPRSSPSPARGPATQVSAPKGIPSDAGITSHA